MKIISNIKLFVFCTLLLGFVYPVMIFWVGNLTLNYQANGSVIYKDQKAIGSKLIGQNFISERYFQGRPSANAYDALASGGTNFSPISRVLREKIEKRKLDGFEMEMLFASGSGLDPHISLKSALIQVDKIVKSRNLDLKLKEKLVTFITNSAKLEEGSLIEKQKVNVLILNLFLDSELN